MAEFDAKYQGKTIKELEREYSRLIVIHNITGDMTIGMEAFKVKCYILALKAKERTEQSCSVAA